MTTLLAFVTVAAFGTWIPLAQLLPGVPHAPGSFTWPSATSSSPRSPSSPAVATWSWAGGASGCRWPAARYGRRATTPPSGPPRRSGSPGPRIWTPLNIIVAFAWGALLFGELDHFSGTRFAILGVALLAVLAGYS